MQCKKIRYLFGKHGLFAFMSTSPTTTGKGKQMPTIQNKISEKKWKILYVNILLCNIIIKTIRAIDALKDIKWRISWTIFSYDIFGK